MISFSPLSGATTKFKHTSLRFSSLFLCNTSVTVEPYKTHETSATGARTPTFLLLLASQPWLTWVSVHPSVYQLEILDVPVHRQSSLKVVPVHRAFLPLEVNWWSKWTADQFLTENKIPKILSEDKKSLWTTEAKKSKGLQYTHSFPVLNSSLILFVEGTAALTLSKFT